MQNQAMPAREAGGAQLAQRFCRCALSFSRPRQVDMDLLVGFNRTRGLTVVMVTHEADMAAYASRTIRFRDGHVESDERSSSVRLQADRDAGVH